LILRLAIVTIGISLGILLKWAPASGYLSLLLPGPQVARTGTLPHDPLVPAAIIPGLPPATMPGAVDPLAAFLGSETLFDPDRRAVFHAHGQQQCASGCAASRHPTATLSRQRFRELLAEMALGGPDQNNRALETLLYYGPQSRRLLSEEQFGPLDLLWKALLERELRQSHVLVSLRVLDESGQIRSRLNHVRVPLDRRHVFAMETENLQPLITSGTVKRVGLDHLWTRL